MLNFYPFNTEMAVLTEGQLCVARMDLGHLCGYVAISSRVVPLAWEDYHQPGIQFLAIHGGVTYTKVEEDYIVFGFDCNHAGDNANELLRDPAHVMQLTVQMRDQLLRLASIYPEFLSSSREEKAKLIDEICSHATIPTSYGLGGMLELLCGAPSLGE